MSELYENNKDIREYVDRYCKTYSFDVEQALEHAIVRHVAEHYLREW